ncbi:hypothetical protein SKAU_G00261950 [Synaphobranchus kaupii]|uniref:Uncharacterized protein n=1 Tax=Synaphobranchus kaupii TaxID=118154 RepID=A0A9Q1EYU8_SYNKA|nr:hypothetical protein SKAU_G00261950 [Synaphobranchus kaupii]
MDNTTQTNCQNVIQPKTSYTRPKEETENSSLMEDAQINLLCNSLESDTESLVQERRYQMELKNRIRQANKMVNPNGEGDTEELEESSGEEEEYNENDLEELEEEDNYIYDSLDLAAPQQGQINTVPQYSEVREILREERHDMFGYGPAEDEYAALRYDPNWRTKLKGDRLFGEGNQLLLEEEESNDYVSPDESPWKPRDRSRNAEQKKRSAHRPAPAIGAESQASECQRPREMLHCTEGAASNRRLKAVPAASNQIHSGENQVISHKQEESYEEMNERYAKEYQLFYDKESARIHETTNNNQNSVYYKLNQSRQLSNVRRTKPKKDIVEQNKMTLGVSTKQASYLSAHSQKEQKKTIKTSSSRTQRTALESHQWSGR